MSTKIRAYAAAAAGKPLLPIAYDPGPLDDEQVEAVTEHFTMSKVNNAMDRLRSGQARYRIVLENGFGA